MLDRAPKPRPVAAIPAPPQRLRVWVWLALLALACGGLACRESEADGQARPLASVAHERRDPAFQTKHRRINELAGRDQLELVFLGDSLIEHWFREGRAVWQRHWGKRRAANFGIGGDRTQHVLWRITHGNVDGIHPAVVVLQVGTNNSETHSAREIVDAIGEILRVLHAKLPESQIVLMSLFPKHPEPSSPMRQHVLAVNALLPELREPGRVHLLDLYDSFLDDEGRLSQEVMFDGLHLTERGYEIWAQGLDPLLARLLPPATD